MRLVRLPSLLLLLYHALSTSPTMASTGEEREEVGFKLVVRQVDITVGTSFLSLSATPPRPIPSCLPAHVLIS
jgi:hypothetical protein